MPCVILDGATYRMWYIGRDDSGPSGRQRMFYAQSTDGLTWVKFPDADGNPAVIVDLAFTGASDSDGIWSPWVIKDGATFRIWYGGEDTAGLVRILYTTSP